MKVVKEGHLGRCHSFEARTTKFVRTRRRIILRLGIFSYSSRGGAGLAARNLGIGMRRIGITAREYFVTDKNIRNEPFRNPATTASVAIDNYVLKSPDWKSNISYLRSYRMDEIAKNINDCEVAILRWSTGLFGFDPNVFRNKKVFWTLPDQIAFTGGCHNSLSCRGFTTGCKSCPAFRNFFQSLPKENLKKKLVYFQSIRDLHFIAHSDYTLEQFLESKLGGDFPITKIENPISDLFFTEKNNQVSKQNYRNLLMIMDRVEDPIKGFDTVVNQLVELAVSESVSFTVIGEVSLKTRDKYPNVRFTGRLQTTEIIREMKKAGLLISASLNESSGATIVEAGSLGVPAIVRGGSGMSEGVGYGKSGWEFQSPSELISMIRSISESEWNLKSKNAVEAAEKRKPELIAQKYRHLFGNAIS